MTLGMISITAGALLGIAAVVCTFVFRAQNRREKQELDAYTERVY